MSLFNHTFQFYPVTNREPVGTVLILAENTRFGFDTHSELH